MLSIHQPDPSLPIIDNNGLDTPAWLQSAVIAEVNLMHATPEGTIDAAIGTLDYFADLGVNCLWIDPVNEMGHSFTYPNGYTNIGLDTIDPALTGTSDYNTGWQKLAKFVNAAHKKGLRVLLDVVTWGVSADVDITREITADGKRFPIGRILQDPNNKEAWSNWGGPKYLYDEPLFFQWYKETMLSIVKTCRLDGIRVDLEPCVTGYELFAEIRREALKDGYRLAIISEHANDRHSAFDIEQMGVVNNWEHDLTKTHANAAYFTRGGYNIVDCIRSGRLSNDAEHTGVKKLYTYCYSTHDNIYCHNGSMLDLIYNALFSPYIPIVYMGESTGDFTDDSDLSNSDINLYYYGRLKTKALERPECRERYEKVKQLLALRRSLPEIYGDFPDDHRQSRIEKVETEGLSSYQPYVCYGKGAAIIVVPNGTDSAADVTITVPELPGISNSASITDALSVAVIPTTNSDMKQRFTVSVKPGEVGLFLLRSEKVQER